jgi:hypothetical protein
MDSAEVNVLLPVFKYDEMNTRIYAGNETLNVKKIGSNRFKLLYSPGFVEGLAAGDEFELLKTDKLGFKVLKRSRNLCVWFFFQSEDETLGLKAKQLLRTVEEIGGWLDGGKRNLLIFTIPITAGFVNIEKVLNEALKKIHGSTWLYGNIYDPEDGATPLNWW